MRKDEIGITDWRWYAKRSEGLIAAIQAVIDDIEDNTNNLGDSTDGKPQLPRRKTILHVLKSLKEFGASHYDFFKQGFRNGELEATTEFPPARVLDAILNQISFDLDVIWRAANQRRISTGKFVSTLDFADRLAWKALEPAVTAPDLMQSTPGDDESKWTVLTYFQKSPSVRVIPYANVALVGIPITCLQEKRDFLAIPHDIGHFVYWRRIVQLAWPAAKSDAAVNRTFVTVVDKVSPEFQHWQEEIFADVYGAIVAGPIMALDFQELMLEYILDQFLSEKDDHASPALRPFIYTKVLEHRGDGEIVGQLEKRWHDQLKARREDRAARILGVTQENMFARALAENSALANTNGLNRVISKALAILGPVTKTNWTGGDIRTPLAAADTLAMRVEPLTADAEDEYTPYRNRITQLTNSVTSIPDLEPRADAANRAVWDAFFTRERYWLPNQTGSEWREDNKVVECGELNDLAEAAENKWLQIWLCGGWTTESPNEPKQP